MTQQKKYKIIDFIAMTVLMCYPLRKVNIGIDMMDAGYALGNYRFFDSLNEIWKLATYLANVTGMLLSHLPYGDTWLGMNVYTALLIGVIASGSYYVLTKYFKNKLLLFMGELAALSLCWAPSVVLYHYMGYFAMTVATLLLYYALTKKKNACYIIAGVVLGSAVFVRMPNITYMAMIIPVWFYGWLQKEKFTYIVGQTFRCIVGYLIGIFVPLTIIIIKYGVAAYPNMIFSLFGMTETATDYKPISMVYAMFEDYIQYSVWLILFVMYLIFGLLFFNIAKGKLEGFKKVLYIIGMLILLRLCYGRGMFGVDYTSYFSMYKWVTVYLLIVIALCVFLLLSHKVMAENKLWALFLLIIIFITPLGSNNGLYPLMNNLFVVAPVSVCLIWDVLKELEQKCVFVKSTFVWRSMGIFILLCTFVQSFLFGVCFVFHDALNKGEQYVQVEIPSASSAIGMRTTADKKEKLEALGRYLTKNQLTEKKVLLYGEIPAIAYLFDMEPAVYTTWADLESNSIERLEADLDSITQEYPVVIVTEDIGKQLEAAKTEKLQEPKLTIISEFLKKGSYVCMYAEKGYCVYSVRENK